jgi:tripartite-type tricarboxylate transporter receptor subunit TctC
MHIQTHTLKLAWAAGAVVTSLTMTTAATAQSNFFADKTISIYVGTGVGSTYDIYARLAADHMGQYIPGHPKIIVQSKPGAGGAVAAAYVYNVAPRDGTVLGVVQQNVPLFQVLSPASAKFDLGKANWIGTFTDIASVLAVFHTSPAKSLEEAKKHVVNVGSTGQGSETFQVPTVLNATQGTKFKVVIGFKGVGDMDLAIERGEIVGRAGSLLSWTARQQAWLREGKVTYLVQIGLVKDKEIPNVPLLLDLAKDDKTRKLYALMSSASAVGRSIFAPPDVPADRVAMLRAAFDKAVADPKLIAEAKKREVTLNPSKGAEIQQIVRDTIATPKEVVDQLRKLLGM